MANVIRSAKSSSKWTPNELIAFNITISTLSPDQFFPTPDPSLDYIDPAILSSPDPDITLSNAAFSFLTHLDLATRTTKKNFVDLFVTWTLQLLGFEALICELFAIPLTICGKAVRATRSDVCLAPNPVTLLMVVVWDTEPANADARVIAQAIGVFQFNIEKRKEAKLDPLDTMIIPCVHFFRTRPTFYLVPVTMELSEAVISGQYPNHTTRVLRCMTVAEHEDVGMENIKYRKVALKRLLAFKEVAKSHWVHILGR